MSRARGRREKAESEREGKVLLNNKAWQPSREPSLASGVILSHSLSVFLSTSVYLFSVFIPLILPHCLFKQPIPCRTSHLQLSVSHFESTLLVFIPLNLALSTLTCIFLSWSHRVCGCGWGCGVLVAQERQNLQI